VKSPLPHPLPPMPFSPRLVDEVCEDHLALDTGPRYFKTPEQFLWLAVLEEALLDVRKHRQGYQETLEWLNNDTNEVRSFRWVLSILGVDPDEAQRKLLASVAKGAMKFHQRGRSRL